MNSSASTVARTSTPATSPALKREGAKSLQVFLDMCRQDGVEPRRQFSGKFNLRLPPELHEAIAAVSAAEGKSINQWVANELSASVKDR